VKLLIDNGAFLPPAGTRRSHMKDPSVMVCKIKSAFYKFVINKLIIFAIREEL